MRVPIKTAEQELLDRFPPDDHLYPLLKSFLEGKTVKTYWSKYPDLRLLKRLGKRRLISFLFFSYLFMFSAAEFTQNIQFGKAIILIQFILFLLITFSVFCFEYGINNCEFTMVIPFMGFVMGAMTCYVGLFGMTATAVIRSPPFDWLLLAFHSYLFFITSAVLVIFAKGTEVLWRGFFTLIDLHPDRDLIEKLKTNAPMEEEEQKQNLGNGMGTRRINGVNVEIVVC
uniref:Uncharacterized protein n=1 Tax=Caenorhabditis tropicalis TaxID=1561998 RepID=A0A1I7TZP0_9PELO